MRGVGEALVDLTGHVVHRPLTLREHIHDLGAPAIPEGMAHRRERVKQRVLRRTIAHMVKLSFDNRYVKGRATFISTLATMSAMSDDRCDLLCLDLPRAEELRLARPSPSAVSRAATGAAALGDPTRLEIAAALDAGGELCVCDLAWITERSQNLVSHHLRALRRADLVSSRRDGKM